MLDTLEPIRKLGEGGEGTVWLAWDRALSRWLAVKIVRLAPGARGVGEALLGSLAPAARELLEPAVAPVLASGILEAPDPRFGVDGLALYIVMPYIQGLPAGELARGPLPARVVAALFAECVRLLTRLHAQGLAHLDLKPSNLLVEARGAVWLVDMHLSSVHGTSGYSAPEQSAPGGQVGPAADWYSLARTLAALWTGQSPRSAADPLQELPAPAVSLTGPERLAHERLAQLIDELSRDEPERRPVPTVAEAQSLARDLGAADPRATLAAAVTASPFGETLAELDGLRAQQPAARPPSEPESVEIPGAARRRLLSWARGAAVVVGLAGMGLYAWSRQAWVSTTAPSSLAPLGEVPDDPVFSNDAPRRPAPVTQIEEADKVPWGHALLRLIMKFPVNRIAILSRNDEVLDEVAAPKVGHIYRWDMRPGVYNYEVDRTDYGPDTKPIILAVRQSLTLQPDRVPHSAPGPERSAAASEDGPDGGALPPTP